MLSILQYFRLLSITKLSNKPGGSEGFFCLLHEQGAKSGKTISENLRLLYSQEQIWSRVVN